PGETDRGRPWRQRVRGQLSGRRKHVHDRTQRRRGTAGMMKRVLVVEDEPVIALGLRDSLEADGYAVGGAAEGTEAEARAREGGFELIVLDIMLPGRDGFSICRNLRASGI